MIYSIRVIKLDSKPYFIEANTQIEALQKLFNVVDLNSNTPLEIIPITNDLIK